MMTISILAGVYLTCGWIVAAWLFDCIEQDWRLLWRIPLIVLGWPIVLWAVLTV